jgi:hypothetical protein
MEIDSPPSSDLKRKRFVGFRITSRARLRDLSPIRRFLASFRMSKRTTREEIRALHPL